MFRTLDDLKKGNDKDKKDNKDKKVTNSYVGGEKSGLAVENPDDFDQIVRKAQDQSANFSGEAASKKVKVTLWQNGFTLNDGPLRDPSEPANKKFLQALQQGRIPDELAHIDPNALDLDLEDKRGEKWVEPPPPKYIAYSGQGITLGGATTTAQTKHTQQVNLSTDPPKVDESKPKTRIQIRFHNGKSQEIEVNLATQLSEIYDYVKRVAPCNFELIAGFPPKPIKDFTQTVEDAGLEDSKVTQKLI